jgi:hypothetical protein
MAKVMEIFIYQNFRAVFILKIKVKIKISANSCLQVEKTWKYGNKKCPLSCKKQNSGQYYV